MNKSDELINKIKKQYAEEYNSTDEVSDEDIKILIRHDCECDNCGKSIFELDDFPDIDNEKDELLCEYCFDSKYRVHCPICEESYLLSDSEQKRFVITEETAKELKTIPGIYEILKYPFFLANCVTGFEMFFDDSIRLIVPIRINELKKIECGENCCEVSSDMICPECEAKYIRKDKFITSQSRLCILLKKCQHDFKDYTPERLHLARQRVIHQRIYERGIIEQANKYTAERLET